MQTDDWHLHFSGKMDSRRVTERRVCGGEEQGRVCGSHHQGCPQRHEQSRGIAGRRATPLLSASELWITESWRQNHEVSVRRQCLVVLSKAKACRVFIEAKERTLVFSS